MGQLISTLNQITGKEQKVLREIACNSAVGNVGNLHKNPKDLKWLKMVKDIKKFAKKKLKHNDTKG